MPLVHDALGFKQPTSFLIDSCGHRIGKMGAVPFGIAGCLVANIVDVKHPAVVQRKQGAVQEIRRLIEFGFRLLGVVLSRIDPGRHECAGLAGYDAVVNHCGVVEQIGHSSVF